MSTAAISLIKAIHTMVIEVHPIDNVPLATISGDAFSKSQIETVKLPMSSIATRYLFNVDGSVICDNHFSIDSF